MSPTRWESAGAERTGFYLDRFSRLIADGSDIEGEARLADALLARAGEPGRGAGPAGGTGHAGGTGPAGSAGPARVLDAGSGMGRVGAAILARGHRVTAVEKDPVLVADSVRRYPDLPVLTADLADLTPELLRTSAQPEQFELIVCVGNVMLYLAEGSERLVLGRFASLLAPGGRCLVGFGLTGPLAARPAYPVEAFTADAASVGLAVELHAGSYDLRPPNPGFAVLVLAAADRPA